jgi:hypothetical protein
MMPCLVVPASRMQGQGPWVARIQGFFSSVPCACCLAWWCLQAKCRDRGLDLQAAGTQSLVGRPASKAAYRCGLPALKDFFLRCPVHDALPDNTCKQDAGTGALGCQRSRKFFLRCPVHDALPGSTCKQDAGTGALGCQNSRIFFFGALCMLPCLVVPAGKMQGQGP